MLTLTGHSIKRTLATVMTASLAASGLAVVAGPASPAEAAKIRVCVKKKTGKMRFLFKKKKKCKKGWKRYVWNQKGVPGPAGTDGAPAPAFSVRDKNQNVLGGFMGVFPFGGGLSLFSVLRDGGIWTYLPSGQAYPIGGGSPKYADNSCTGFPYLDVSSPESLQLILGSVGGTGRLIYRPTSPTLGTARAFVLTVANTAYSGNLWELDNTGTCVPDPSSPFTGTLVQLDEVPAPPDVPGPLTVG